MLDLSNQELTALDSIFAHTFHGKSKITSIILTRNKLTRLFESSCDIVAPQVEALDLRDNVLEDVPFTVMEIQRAMPNLKDLKLNLYEEDHVDFIMRHMP